MRTAAAHPRVAIVGLGNVLLMDDGAGIHAVRELRKDPPDGVIVAEVGTAVLGALDLLEEADAVVAIDAVEAGGPPGSIYRFDASDAAMDRAVSLHELGVIGALRLMPRGRRPAVTILGVEPERMDYGMELSPAVRAVLPHVVRAAREIAEEIRRRGGRSAAPRRTGSVAHEFSG